MHTSLCRANNLFDIGLESRSKERLEYGEVDALATQCEVEMTRKSVFRPTALSNESPVLARFRTLALRGHRQLGWERNSKGVLIDEGGVAYEPPTLR
jgi:hypothetical protein